MSMAGAWSWSYSGGSFEVNFVAGRLEHTYNLFLLSFPPFWNFNLLFGIALYCGTSGGEFVCKDYPEHSHWSQEGNQIKIDWGKYGRYELVIGPDGRSMSGCYAGHPSEWRKAVFLREHTAQETEQFLQDAKHSHEHGHHEHGSCCGHHH
jgi:hypothetical protein